MGGSACKGLVLVDAPDALHLITAETHALRYISDGIHPPIRSTTAEMHPMRFITAEMHHSTFTRFCWVSRCAYRALAATVAFPAAVHHCAARLGLTFGALLCSFVCNFYVNATLAARSFVS